MHAALEKLQAHRVAADLLVLLPTVDNLFVFILVFNYLKVAQDDQNKVRILTLSCIGSMSKSLSTTAWPQRCKHTPLPSESWQAHIRITWCLQVLTYGLISAAVLRAIMILGGAALIENFEPVLLGFAGVLLFSSFKLLSADDDDDDEDLTDNFIVKLCRCSHAFLADTPMPSLCDVADGVWGLWAGALVPQHKVGRLVRWSVLTLNAACPVQALHPSVHRV